jgi:hypothetical protein
MSREKALFAQCPEVAFSARLAQVRPFIPVTIEGRAAFRGAPSSEWSVVDVDDEPRWGGELEGAVAMG